MNLKSCMGQSISLDSDWEFRIKNLLTISKKLFFSYAQTNYENVNLFYVYKLQMWIYSGVRDLA